MLKLTLLDILSNSPENIIKLTNSSTVNLDEYAHADVEPKRTVYTKDYKGLLFRNDILVGKEFELNNHFMATITNVFPNNNAVSVIVHTDPPFNARLNLYKLTKESLDNKSFPYNIGELYMYKKNGKEETIKITNINPSQKAIGYVDKNGTKRLIRVSKLEKIKNIEE